MGGFEELLPSELAATKRAGPYPMRPAPPKPPSLAAGGASVPVPAASPASPSHAAPPSVDGVPDAVVDAWFQHADLDGDGRVADKEAREFFLTSGLAAADLSKIWKLVKSPEVIAREGKGLSRYRFAQVLRLIALAQCPAYAFNEQNATAALHSHSWMALHSVPLPPPRIGSQAQRDTAAAAVPAAPAAAQAASGNPFAAGSAQPPAPPAAIEQLFLPQEGWGLQPAAIGATSGAGPAASANLFAGEGLGLGPTPAAAASPAHDDDDDLFGLNALRAQAAAQQAAAAAAQAQQAASAAAQAQQAASAAAQAQQAASAAAQAQQAASAAAQAQASAWQAAGAASQAEAAAGPPTAGIQRQTSLQGEASLSRSIGASGRTRKAALQRSHTSTMEPPVAFDVRLPPLQPKLSAKLTMLAAGNGSLFAAPAVGGGLLQWGRAEGNMRRPLDVEGQHTQQGKLGRLVSDLMYSYTTESQVPSEDSDAAPAIEVATSDRGRTAACLLVDEGAQLLWVADKEGWVSAFDISGEPSMSLRAGHRSYHFQAYRVGYVTALCRTPQGQLWTGSSRGNIRIWELGEPALVGEAPEPPRCRELRKGFGERAHSGQVLQLVCPADGQLVWSASAKGVLLWDAACGAFLGALVRSTGRLGPGGQQLELLAGGGPADGTNLNFKIDSSKGLEIDRITGYVVARPYSSDWPRITADQEAWAAQTDNNINELMERVSIGGSKMVQGAGKTLKLLGKLARGFGASNPSGAGAAASSTTASVAAGTPGPNTEGSGGPKVASRAPSGNALFAGSGGAVLFPDEDPSQFGAAPAANGPVDITVGGIVAVLTPLDGSVWVAHKCGTVDRYTSAGQRLGSDECKAVITAAACIGQRVWIGFSDGVISVRDQGGTTVRVFQAHHAGILSIAQAGSRTYTLAADGSIKGWSSAVPHPSDLEALYSWDEQAADTFRRESLRVLTVTWNVGESKPEAGSSFFRWVHEAAFNTQLAVVGLQEIEMGSSSVALAAAKDAFSQKMQEKGNTNAKFWSSGVLAALGGERHWHQVGLRQLSGMLILVYARNHLKDQIGEVATASVACGVLGVGGNKGAVAVEFSVHRRKIAVLCSHFAAHQGAVEARNANYATICRQLTFSRRAWFADEEEGGGGGGGPLSAKRKGPSSASASASTHVLALEDLAMGDVDSDDGSSIGAGDAPVPSAAVAAGSGPVAASVLSPEELVQGEGMREAAMLVWLGDFNYRIEGGYEAVKERAIRNELGPLLELDQCRREMAAGRVFRGLREGPITFRPTYKFDKASANPFAYDTSEKRRIPAWCDRIFFRGSTPFPTPQAEDGESVGVTDEEADVTVTAQEYGCWADVTDSDHKPVYAVLEANLPITDQAKKRVICSALLKDCAAAALEGGDGAACNLQPDHIKLHPTAMPRQAVLLRNDSPAPLMFDVTHDILPAPPGALMGGGLGPGGGGGALSAADSAAAAFNAQQLMEVRPVRGVVQPGQDAQLQVHLAGEEWELRGANPPDLTYTVRVGSEFSSGGESTAPGIAHLTFHATCLTSL